MGIANNKFSWGIISQNRKAIYGFSIIFVMLFHSTAIDSSFFALYNEFKNICNVGVDVFLFVSGISLYFSFLKDSNILNFYKKRFQRIIIPALIVGIPYFLGRDVLLYKLSFTDFLLNVTGLSLFTARVKTIWFVTAIILFYIAYPFIFKFFDMLKWKLYSLGIALVAIIGVYAVISSVFPNFWHNSEILFRRFPIFIVGAYWGRLVHNDVKTKCSNWIVAVSGIVSIVAILILHILIESPIISYRYIYGIAAIPITMLFAVIGNFRSISKIVEFLSPYTFEIYLLNEKCANISARVLSALGMSFKGDIVVRNIVTMILTVALAIVLKKIVDKFFELKGKS